MQGGDLATWQGHRVVVVLEGVLVDLPEAAVKKTLLRRKAKPQPLPPVESWAWQKLSIKNLNNTARLHSIPIDVVTFTSEEVAESAGEWFENYYVEVSSTAYRDFDQFCESIQWTPDVDRVVDSDPLRLSRYGQRGYQCVLGGVF